MKFLIGASSHLIRKCICRRQKKISPIRIRRSIERQNEHISGTRHTYLRCVFHRLRCLKNVYVHCIRTAGKIETETFVRLPVIAVYVV